MWLGIALGDQGCAAGGGALKGAKHFWVLTSVDDCEVKVVECAFGRRNDLTGRKTSRQLRPCLNRVAWSICLFTEKYVRVVSRDPCSCRVREIWYVISLLVFDYFPLHFYYMNVSNLSG